MATRKDVETKAAQQRLAVRTRQDQETGRTVYRFFAYSMPSYPGARVSFPSPGWLHECSGARAALAWLKERRERIRADIAASMARVDSLRRKPERRQ